MYISVDKIVARLGTGNSRVILFVCSENSLPGWLHAAGQSSWKKILPLERSGGERQRERESQVGIHPHSRTNLREVTSKSSASWTIHCSLISYGWCCTYLSTAKQNWRLPEAGDYSRFEDI